MMGMLAYVIVLKKTEDNFIRIKNQLKKLNFNVRPKKYFGLNGNNHNYYDKDLDNKTHCLSRTNYMILKEAKAKNQQYVMIIEDDANFYSELIHLENKTPAQYFEESMYQFMRDKNNTFLSLGSFGVGDFTTCCLGNMIELNVDRTYTNFYKGCHAMVYNVEKALPIFREIIKTHIPHDIYFSYLFSDQCRCYLSVPMLCSQKKHVSNIRGVQLDLNIYQRLYEAKLLDFVYNRHQLSGVTCTKALLYELPFAEEWPLEGPCECEFCSYLNWRKIALSD